MTHAREWMLGAAALLCAALPASAAQGQAPEAPPPAAQVMLWPDAPPESAPGETFRPFLEPFLVEGPEVRGAVVVCPGGGYGGRAAHEGAPIAQRLNAAGIHAFVLQYRVAPNRHPVPLMDAARAVRLVRQHAAEWRVKPDHIAILGFSAGGHLTGSLAVHWKDAPKGVEDEAAQQSCRPDAAVLCYPVLSSGTYGHRSSFNNLLGPDAKQEALDYMSLEKQVTADTPPVFLWHTADDEGVPVENSLLFAMAARAQGVPVELHVYPHGKHGLGLSEADPHIATWMELCAQWLHGMGW